MVRLMQRRPIALIRDRYFGVLDTVMREHGIGPATERPDVNILPGTRFADVVRYTDWYCGYNSDRPHNRPHYRYKRYRKALDSNRPTGRRQVNVDIGCGAGTFGWAFMDWARESDFSCDNIDIYGFDHSPAMIDLAEQIWVGLLDYIPDYRGPYYYDDPDALLAALSEHHRPDTNYTITFGYTLIQAHTRTADAIPNFARTIKSILDLKDPASRCTLVAVDSLMNPAPFASAWDALLNNLRSAGVRPQLRQILATRINSSTDAKIAGLALA